MELWRERYRLALLLPLLLVHLLLTAPVSAAPPALYHSPGDDGVSGGVPAFVDAGSGVTLYLYLDVGAAASTADPCFQGDGDELCGHRLRLTTTDIEIQSFTTTDPDLVVNLSVGQLDLTGGDFQVGELGPTKLGNLVINAPTPGGTLDLVLGEFVTTQLVKESATTPETIVQVPEPGGTLALAVGVGLLAALHHGRSNGRQPRRHPDRSPR